MRLILPPTRSSHTDRRGLTSDSLRKRKALSTKAVTRRLRRLHSYNADEELLVRVRTSHTTRPVTATMTSSAPTTMPAMAPPLSHLDFFVEPGVALVVVAIAVAPVDKTDSQCCLPW